MELRTPSPFFADVAVPLPLFQTFTYSVPDTLRDELQPGCRVLVPFGTRRLVGLVTLVHQESREGAVKPILEILDRKPLFSPSLLKLGLWMASYYLAPPGEAMRVMLPPGLLAKKVALDEDQAVQKFWPTKRRLAVVEMTSSEVQLTPRQQEIVELLGQRPFPWRCSRFYGRLGEVPPYCKTWSLSGSSEWKRLRAIVPPGHSLRPLRKSKSMT